MKDGGKENTCVYVCVCVSVSLSLSQSLDWIAVQFLTSVEQEHLQYQQSHQEKSLK